MDPDPVLVLNSNQAHRRKRRTGSQGKRRKAGRKQSSRLTTAPQAQHVFRVKTCIYKKNLSVSDLRELHRTALSAGFHASA